MSILIGRNSRPLSIILVTYSESPTTFRIMFNAPFTSTIDAHDQLCCTQTDSNDNASNLYSINLSVSHVARQQTPGCFVFSDVYGVFPSLIVTYNDATIPILSQQINYHHLQLKERRLNHTPNSPILFFLPSNINSCY